MLTRSAGTRGRVVAAALGMVLAWGSVTDVATAALVTFTFEGKVTYVYGETPAVQTFMESQFGVSDKLVGSYSFHSDTPDRNPVDTTKGVYSLTQLSTTLAGKTFISIHNSFGPVVATHTTPTFDSTDRYPYQGFYYPNRTGDSQIYSNLSGPQGDVMGAYEFRLAIPGFNSVTNDSLPLTPPSIGNALSGRTVFEIFFHGYSGQFQGLFGSVQGELTSLTLAPVPVPGAVLLFGSGVLGLAAFKRSRRTRQL